LVLFSLEKAKKSVLFDHHKRNHCTQPHSKR